LTKVRNCFAVRIALMSSGRAHAHPTFQPVKEKVFAADDIVIVRSAMPASDASERWGDS